MLKIVFVFITLLVININSIYSQKDLGYKSNCFEDYYPSIVYGELIKIIDSSTFNNLTKEVNNNKFSIYLQLNINTDKLDSIIIIDSLSLLTSDKKAEIKKNLYNYSFNICHDDYFYKQKKAKQVYKGLKTIKFGIGSFYYWWYRNKYLK